MPRTTSKPDAPFNLNMNWAKSVMRILHTEVGFPSPLRMKLKLFLQLRPRGRSPEKKELFSGPHCFTSVSD